MSDLIAVEQALSTSRLEPYIKAGGGGLAEGFELYEWNLSVSAAFFEVLAHLEVGVRNALHAQLVRLADRQDWWASPRMVLTPIAVDMLDKAVAEVSRRSSPGGPDHVVAALPFGFWAGLVSSGHRYNYEMTLWRPGLHRAFPGYRGTRSELHLRLNTLRLLRNRIAHHEPIYRRHLAADHDTILMLSNWIMPAFARWMASRSRVPDLLSSRPHSAGHSCR
ncbi:hypothetical protein [Micromonospora sp. WMMD714]|uniref:hypothetical protein n=1 Tax=Micromonospora sp. WMMD714 TaxID=3016097 RepID=UPI00249B6AA7|nr:hypothetical protein [Micromonospora sp. WMMD714]WFE62633.1 hypothetical protein O7625_04715 [Micromonospora sp. WMMD714]